jgi:hypothetical protein
MAYVYSTKPLSGSQPPSGHYSRKLADIRRIPETAGALAMLTPCSGRNAQRLCYNYSGIPLQLNTRRPHERLPHRQLAVATPTVVSQLRGRALLAGGLKWPAGAPFFIGHQIHIGEGVMAENRYLAVRMTPQLRQQLEAEAKVRGIRTTELMRQLAVEFLDRRGRAKREKTTAFSAN